MVVQINTLRAFEDALDQIRELIKQNIQQNLVIEALKRENDIKDSLLQKQDEMLGEYTRSG